MAGPRVILAFDLAIATGVAVGPADGTPEAWTERLAESTDAPGARFAQAIRLCTRLIREHRPSLVAVEKAIASGPKGKSGRVASAMGLRACVLAAAHAAGLRPVEVPVATARKRFIGVGNLPSKEAKAAVFRRCRLLGWTVTDEDQADACAVWEYARAASRSPAATLPAGLFDGRTR